MPRLIHTIAMIAAMAALAAALWQNWGLWATAKRMVIAYLAFFFIGGTMAVVVRSVSLFEKKTDKTEEPSDEQT